MTSKQAEEAVMELAPATPQPFDPPVPAAVVWQVPRDAPEFMASMLYAYVTWGREPHHWEISEEDLAAFELVRPQYEIAVEQFLTMFARIGYISRESAAREAFP